MNQKSVGLFIGCFLGLMAIASSALSFSAGQSEQAGEKGTGARKVTLKLFKDGSDHSETLKLLEKVKTKGIYDLAISHESIADFGEEKLRFKVLIPMSYDWKIQVHKTNKAKSLYSHLVVYIDDEPFTYYPQKRKNAGDITINRFLEELIKGKIDSLHDCSKLLKELRKKPQK